MNPAAEPGGRDLRGEPEPIPGQLVLPGMPSERETGPARASCRACRT